MAACHPLETVVGHLTPAEGNHFEPMNFQRQIAGMHHEVIRTSCRPAVQKDSVQMCGPRMGRQVKTPHLPVAPTLLAQTM